MIDSILFNSTENILFFILTIIPICFYFFWKIGYHIRILKIPLFVSIICAFYFFLTSNNYLFSFEDSLKTIIGKLLFLNLLLFSTIFTIIILIIPTNQKINEKTQTTIVREEREIFNSNLEWSVNKGKYNSTHVGNKYREEELIQNDLKGFSERKEQEKSDDEFQKLINNIYENQNKK